MKVLKLAAAAGFAALTMMMAAGPGLGADTRSCVAEGLGGSGDVVACRTVATLLQTEAAPKSTPKGVRTASGSECPANSNSYCPDEAPDCKYDGSTYFCCSGGSIGCVGAYCCASDSYCCGSGDDKGCCK